MTLLFACAHTASTVQTSPAARFPKDSAIGLPAALILSDASSLQAALVDALAGAGVAVDVLTSDDEHEVLKQLGALATEYGGSSAHRFIVALGNGASLTALRAASKEPLAGIVLISPPPVPLGEAGEPYLPTLLLRGEAAPPLGPEVHGPIWDLRFTALDKGYSELGHEELHTLTEAVVLWMLTRSK